MAVRQNVYSSYILPHQKGILIDLLLRLTRKQKIINGLVCVYWPKGAKNFSFKINSHLLCMLILRSFPKTRITYLFLLVRVTNKNQCFTKRRKFTLSAFCQLRKIVWLLMLKTTTYFDTVFVVFVFYRKVTSDSKKFRGTQIV